ASCRAAPALAASSHDVERTPTACENHRPLACSRASGSFAQPAVAKAVELVNRHTEDGPDDQPDPRAVREREGQPEAHQRAQDAGEGRPRNPEWPVRIRARVA